MILNQTVGGDPTGPRRLIHPTLLVWPLLPGLLLGAVYLSSAARDISWGHLGVDGGDLIAAAATGGVAHPSGYPTYLALAGLFLQLPVGSPAFRVGLLSLVTTVAAALIAGGLVRRYSGSGVAALVTALLYGLAPLAWGQALIAEVYALHMLFVAGLLAAMVHRADGPRQTAHDRAAALALGIGLGNHLTLALMAPAWLLARRPRLATVLLALLAGIAVYATLFVRAGGDSPVNWGRPDTAGRLGWLVSGGLYREHLAPPDAAVVAARLQALPTWLSFQLGAAGSALALAGVLLTPRPPRRMTLACLWIAGAYSLFAVLYPVHDSQVNLLPAILALAVWAGLGLAAILRRLAARPGWAAFTIVAALGLIGWRAAQQFPTMDLRGDGRARTFADRVLTAAPADAILVGDSDSEVFTLWYALYVEGRRPDLVIVAEGLANYSWYRQTLRQTYPEIHIPELVTTDWGVTLQNANTRPVCQLHAAGLTCLP